MRTATIATALLLAAAPLAAQTQLSSPGDIAGAQVLTWNALGTGSLGTIQNYGVVGTGQGTDLTGLVAGTGWQGGFSTGDGLVFVQGGITLDLWFNTTLFAVGTQLWHDFPNPGPGNTPGTFTIEAWRGAVSLGSFAVGGQGGLEPNNDQGPFLGLADDLGFDRIRFTGTGPFAINDLVYATEAGPGNPGEVVPEPATMTLLASGLVGMAAARRRRRQAIVG